MNGFLIHRLAATMLVAVVALAAPAKADLIVTMGDATIQPGGNSFLDIHVTSSSGTLSLASYIFELEITGPGGPALEFSIPQMDSHLGDSNYVFNGNSFAFATSSGTSSGTVDSHTYVGFDATNSGTDVELTTTPRLLARVDLSGLNILDSMVGQPFTVTFRDDLSSFFDAASSSLDLNPASDLLGTITVTQAVPEPSSLVLVATALGCGGVFQRRRNIAVRRVN